MTKSTEQRHPPHHIERFNPVDGEFFLVHKADGTLLAKAYTLQDARLISQSQKLLEFAEKLNALCAVQANLNSTASEADRSRFISEVYALWNDHGRFTVAAATGKEAA